MTDHARALIDPFGRRIRVLRIAITDRCDIACTYCVPPGSEPPCPIARRDALSADEIAAVVEAAAGLGVDRVRLTGGEPLVRPDVVDVVARLAPTPGLERLSLTTNAQRLAALAAPLAGAGLHAVNVSIDALDPALFARIRRGASLERALAGVDAALAAGLDVKVNAVIMRGVNESEVVPLALLALRKPVHVRFLEYMPGGLWDPENPDFGKLVPGDEILARLEASIGKLEEQPVVDAAGPAVYHHVPGAAGRIGVITAVTRPFCDRCNRMRLLADGRLRPCLFADETIDVRAAIPRGRAAVEDALRRAVAGKPEGGMRGRTFPLRATGG